MELLNLWKQRDMVSKITYFSVIVLIILLQMYSPLQNLGIGYSFLLYFLLIVGSHYVQRLYYSPKFKQASINIQKELQFRFDTTFYMGLYEMHSYLAKNTKGSQNIQSEIAAFLSFRFASNEIYPRSTIIKNIVKTNDISEIPFIEAVYDHLAVYQLSKNNFDAYIKIRKELINRLEEAIDNNKYDTNQLDSKIKQVACLKREVHVFEKQDKKLFEELQKPMPKYTVQSQLISMYVDLKIANYFEWDDVIEKVKATYPIPNSESYIVSYIKNA